jgi:hypothetical protein
MRFMSESLFSLICSCRVVKQALRVRHPLIRELVKAADGKRLVNDGLKPPGVAVCDVGGDVPAYVLAFGTAGRAPCHKPAWVRLPALFSQRRWTISMQ